jgi:hypothetical protein
MQSSINALKADPELAVKVKAFANLFHELGSAYAERSVDRPYTAEVFDFLAPYYWTQLEFWIDDYRRQKKSPTLYERFWHLANAMEAYRREKGHTSILKATHTLDSAREDASSSHGPPPPGPQS